MQNYNVWQLVLAVNMIRDCEFVLEKACMDGLRDTYIDDPFVSHMLGPTLAYCKDQFQKIELNGALYRLGGVLHGSVNARVITNEKLQLQLHELRADIDRDLALRRFAFVPLNKTEMCDRVTLRWGKIWQAFAESEDDSRAATDCYVLGLYTASVFHAMRVAEIGLRNIAKNMRVKLTDKGRPMPIEFGTWEKVIVQVNNKIKEARLKSKGHKAEVRLQFYSEAADHCMYMKDLWRNSVSHARKSYNDGEALGALNRVHDFMQFLSTGAQVTL
jgi:hypothetical protein